MVRKYLLLLLGVLSLTGCNLGNEINEKVKVVIENANGILNESRKNDADIITRCIVDSNINLWDNAAENGVQLNGYAKSSFRYAYEESTPTFVSHIIENGIDVNYIDSMGRNELMFMNSIYYSPVYCEIVDKLIAQGCDINYINHDGNNLIEDLIDCNMDRPQNVFARKKKMEFLLEKQVKVRKETIEKVIKSEYTGYAEIELIRDCFVKNNPEYQASDCVESVLLGDMNGIYDRKNITRLSEQEKAQIVFYLAAFGTLEDFEQFLDISNQSIKVVDTAENTLLMAAAMCGNEEVVRYLWDKVPHDSINLQGGTLLSSAICGDNFNVIHMVLKEENSSDYKKYFPNEGLIETGGAILSGISLSDKRELLDWLLKNDCSNIGHYMCMEFLRQNNISFLKTVLDNPNLQMYSDDKGFCQQILASCYTPQQVEIVIAFADSKIRRELGYSLSTILSDGKGIIKEIDKIIEIFIAAGVEVNDGNEYTSPLIDAVGTGDTVAVELLIENGADLDRKAVNGRYDGVTPLMIAARGDSVILEKLLEGGAEPDITDEENRSALMGAVLYHSEPCIELLLKYGANKDIVNTSGETAYDIAVQKGNRRIIELLK